jgi:hypothetical protein
MTVPTHFKFTFRGHFDGTPEFWSFGCHFNRKVGEGADAGLSDINESGVTAAIATLMGDASFGTVTRLDDWRAYQIGTDGKMEGNAPLLHTVDPGSPVAGAGGMNFPPQIAVCVTKVAPDRGPAKLGRMFLPCLGAAIGAGGRLSDTNAMAIAQATSAFLKSISDAIDLPGTIESSACVNVSEKPVATGTLQDVDHIRVGRAFDTMRSRRTSLLEDYVDDAHIDW